MSEDDIDRFNVKLVELVETWPKSWPNDDELYGEFCDFTHNFFEKYLTKERNYN